MQIVEMTSRPLILFAMTQFQDATAVPDVERMGGKGQPVSSRGAVCMGGWGRVAPTVAACGGATLSAVQLICNHLGVKFFGAFIARLFVGSDTPHRRQSTLSPLSSARFGSVQLSSAQ